MPTLPQKPTCGVCLDNPSKYKCPTCILPYCSLSCYKRHKETPCEKPAPPPAPAPKNDTSASTSPEDDSETALKSDQLRKLAASSKIQEYLRYPQIRDLIAQIDSGADPEALLDRAREDDLVFAEFAEEALATVTGERWRQEDG